MTALAFVLAEAAQVITPDVPVTPGAVLGGLMIITAGLASFVFWSAWLSRRISLPADFFAEPEPAANEAPSSEIGSPPEELLTVPASETGAQEGSSRFPIPPAALLLAAGWIGIVLALKFAAGMAPERPEPAQGQLLVGLGLELGLQLLVYLILFVAVVSGPLGAPWKRGQVRRSVLVGLLGFVAAIGPVLVVMFLLKSQRTDDTEHQLLRILRDADSTSIIGLICLTAAVVAPLSEELTYRVTLIGGTEPFIGRYPALVGSSLLFAAVHGFPDAVALLPLALVLGWIYQETRSYVAVVTTHAAFNAFNLAVVLIQTWLT